MPVDDRQNTVNGGQIHSGAMAAPAAHIVSSFDDIGLDERTWNALAACGGHSVFQTYQWARSWWTAYGSRYEPLFVVSRTAAGITGLAPLVVDASTNRGRVVRFLGDGRADYCDLLTADNGDAVRAMLRAIRDYPHWDVLDLSNVPAGSRTAGLVAAAAHDAGLHLLADDQFVCPTLIVRGNEKSVERLANTASLRRRRTYFERRGRLECQDLAAAAAIQPFLDGFFAQHIARWRHTPTPSLFHEPANQEFYRELTARLDGTRWLLFSRVTLDDKPIAMHYGFDFGETITWYKPSFDPEFAAGSPGVVLVQHLIQRALSEGRRELDFTIGDEVFKSRFTNHARRTVRLQAFRDPARYMFERSKRSVVAAMKRAATRMRQM